MASADYSVGTKVTADVSNFEKGMNKAEKSLKGFSDKLANSIDRLGKKGLIGSVANVTLAMQGLTQSFNTVIKFAKNVSQAINDCTEAYKGQLIAEKALDTAIANNPFISGASSKALKEFASEMQKVSNYGDEELIPMMTNLVSLGRTESETMQIMSVAMDMSAGMGISLDTAITQLNATLNGNIGRLGQQNAELKGLTEEELKQGKAIEILGEKFKGLSGATADTSKQLQNMKGDFKEALGQFTLPSSDMWNKFWTGFYEKGIEVINKINAFIDAQTIGKKLAGNFVTYFDSLTGDIGDKLDYIEDYLAILSESELQALNNYLSGLRKATDVQKIILKESDREIKHRALNAQIAKEEAEDKKRQAVVEAQITTEVQKQEEIASKKTDWASKLLDQRIEMLETERDRAISYAEEEGQETYTIWRDYNEKILELKLERLEKEKEKALEEEGLTAEDKIKVEEYYSEEIKKIYNELGIYKKKKGDEEEKDEKNKFAKMLEYAKQYAEKIKQVFSKVVSTIKNIFSGGYSLLKKLFEINPDEILNNILKVEDSILTFFVETLPKLPDFFSSAIESIIKLIDTLMNVIDWSQISNILNGIVDVIIKNAPTIINNLLIIAENMIKTVLEALKNFVESGGWKMLLDLFLTIQKTIEQIVVDNIDDLVNTIIDMLPDLIETLKNSIVSASRTLGKLAPKILPMIAELINAIVEVITSDEVIDSANEAVEGIVEGLVEAIIKLLPNAILKILNMAIKLANPQRVSKLAIAIVKGLAKAFAKIDWIQFVKECFMGFIDGFKELFGIHSPSTLFEGFGLNMVEGLVNGLQGISDAVNTILEPLYKLVTDVFGGIGDFINTSLSVSFQGLSDILNSSGNAFSKITNSVANLVKQLKNLIKEVNNATSALFGGGGGGGGGVDDIWDVFDPFHFFGGHAKGTNNAQKGLALVGEAGPELVRFRGGEQVLNNHNTNKALENMGGKTINQSIIFNNLKDTTAFAMMQQMKQYNRALAINGVI